MAMQERLLKNTILRENKQTKGGEIPILKRQYMNEIERAGLEIRMEKKDLLECFHCGIVWDFNNKKTHSVNCPLCQLRNDMRRAISIIDNAGEYIEKVLSVDTI